MAKYFKFELNTPLTFVPKYDQGKEQDPPPEHPNWSKSYLWGVTVNGEEGFLTVTPMLNDKLLNAGIKAGVPITVTKIQGADRKVSWEVKNGAVTPANPQPAPTPQPTPENASEAQISPPTQSSKDRWITILALLKFVPENEPVHVKVTQAFQMEYLIKKALERQDKGQLVTAESIAADMDYLENQSEAVTDDEELKKLYG